MPTPTRQRDCKWRRKKERSDGADGFRPPCIYIFLLLHCLEILLRQLVLIIVGVSIHDTQVVNSVRTYLPQVMDKDITYALSHTSGLEDCWFMTWTDGTFSNARKNLGR